MKGMKKKGRGMKLISKKSLSIVMAVVLVSSVLIAFVPLAAAPVTITKFEITPTNNIADATSAYIIQVNTTGFKSLNITIPAGFRAVTPTSGEVQIAKIEYYDTSGWFGNVTIWSGDTLGENLSTNASIDGYNRSGVYSGGKIGFGVNYSAGGKTVIPSPFVGNPDVINLTLPIGTTDGSLNISLPSSIVLTNASISIGQYVRNPAKTGDYVFTADGVPKTVRITAEAPPAPPRVGGGGGPCSTTTRSHYDPHRANRRSYSNSCCIFSRQENICNNT